MSIFTTLPIGKDGWVSAGVVADAGLAGDVLMPVQTHSCNVAEVTAGSARPEDTDALICRQAGVKIGVRTADCVPILLYAPDIRAVAAIHAGWKGSLNGIVDNTLHCLRDMGADITRIEACFGPSICGNCYEVSPEMIEEFKASGFGKCIIGARNLDLEAVNRQRLRDCGVAAENIGSMRICTRETPALPSWRRQQSTRRLVTYISICEQ